MINLDCNILLGVANPNGSVFAELRALLGRVTNPDRRSGQVHLTDHTLAVCSVTVRRMLEKGRIGPSDEAILMGGVVAFAKRVKSAGGIFDHTVEMGARGSATMDLLVLEALAHGHDDFEDEGAIRAHFRLQTQCREVHGDASLVLTMVSDDRELRAEIVRRGGAAWDVPTAVRNLATRVVAA